MTPARGSGQTVRIGEWTIEYRWECRGWELMQGSAHRGIYQSESDARTLLAEIEGRGA